MRVCVLVLVLGSLGAAAYTCTKVNGVRGACDLMLNQITLAGSRLSGCGGYGTMYFWSGLPATACGYATQDKSITSQLHMGIRYFDFDLGYIGKSEESLPYWEAGPVLVSIGSSVAYSKSLRAVLQEIKDFMDSNRDEFVAIRLGRYTPRDRETLDSLLRTVKPTFDKIFGKENKFGDLQAGPQITFYSTLKPLKWLVENNQRIQLILNKDLWGRTQSDFRATGTLEFQSQTNLYGYNSCANQHQISEFLLDIGGINKRNIPATVNWWLSSGRPCLSEKASLCMNDVGKIETIWNEVISGTHLHRPINIVRADYVRPALGALVKKLNEKAVAYYKQHPW